MELSDKDQGLLQLGIDALTQHLAGLGLTLVIEQDFARLNAFLKAQGTFANPTYDPERSRLGPRDFWIRLLDAEGRGVGCSAERMIETHDLTELIATGRLWYAGGFAAMGGPERVPITRPSRTLAGRISHSGSTWVDPTRRGQALAMLMTYLTRALSFRNFGVSANTGIVRESLYRTRVPAESYGYPHIEPVIDGFFPPLNCVDRIYLCWVDTAEFLESIEALPAHPRQPVPLLPADTPALTDAFAG